MAKSLIAALSAGIRPGPGLRASLQTWLGVDVNLQNHAFWQEYGRATGGSSFTGTRVTVDNALQLSVVWACVRLISETLATLPLGFYERAPDGSRTPATRHPLYEILHNQPNAEQTAVVFWEVVVASMLLWGNSYNEILRGGNDVVIGLNFLYPARVSRRRLEGGGYEWKYLEYSGKTRTIADRSMMHTLAFSTDGEIGLSPIVYGANVMGTALETDEASAQTFEDSMRSPGLVMMDTVLKKDQREDIRQHVKKVSEDGGIMVLEKGAGFQKIGFDPVSAELLASRRWNAEELCRWYSVDPAMVGITGKDSNWGTGLEQKMIWFVTLTLRKWCVRIEQSVRKCLLTPVERQRYFAEFAMEGLLRGDSAARAAFYSTMTQNGIMKRDECRVLENLPREGGNADVLTVQSNMLPIDKLGQEPPAPQQPFGAATELDRMQHAEAMAMAARPIPAPHVTVAPANVEVNVPAANHSSAITALGGVLAAAIERAGERQSPLPEINLNVSEGAFRSNVSIEPTRIEVAEGAISVRTVTASSDEPQRTLVKHRVLETDAAGLPSKVMQIYEMTNPKQPEPAAPEPPASGTVLRVEETEVIERDAKDHILKTRKLEIAP